MTVAPPLAGLRVLELTHYLAGPYCTLFLADLGADVIKIESPDHPDLGRAMPGCRIEGEPAYFHCLNRGKRSVALDLKSEAGRAAFYRLVETAQVVVDNFRLGVMERLGADSETLRRMNPSLVTCSLTGFGATGPKRDLPAYDYLIQALSGMMSLTGDPGGKPTKYGISIVDHTSGVMGAFAILAALRGVEQTGIGRHVDLALLDSHVHMLTYLAADYLNCGMEPERYEDSAHPYIVPSQRFSTRDGDLVIMPMADRMWIQLCEALERRRPRGGHGAPYRRRASAEPGSNRPPARRGVRRQGNGPHSRAPRRPRGPGRAGQLGAGDPRRPADRGARDGGRGRRREDAREPDQALRRRRAAVQSRTSSR